MELKQLLDPRVMILPEQQKDRVVELGGANYRYEVLPSDSSSDTQARWQFQPASTSTIIDRKIYIRAYVEFVGDNPFEIGVNSAPRQFPLASAMEDLTVQINGTSISTQPKQYIHAFSRYGNDAKNRDQCLSMTPSKYDQFQEYKDWADVVPIGSGGSARNPLANYGESELEQNRGGFSFVSLSPDKKTVRYTFTEPLFISPLEQYGHNREGLVNVNQLIVNIRWDSVLSRMWSESTLNPAYATTVTTTFYDKPELLINSITPNILQQPSLPCVVHYPYYEPQTYIRNIGVIPANTTNSPINSDSIKLSQVPKHVMIFARRSRGTSTHLTSDTLASIQNITVFWDNRIILSGATPQQLYQISKRNGYNGNWEQYSKYTGSPFMFSLASDTGLPDGMAPGVRTQSTLKVDVTFRNTSKNDVEYEFYVIPVLEGTIAVSENSMINSLGNLCKQDVLMTVQSGTMITARDVGLSGDGLWGGLKHFFNGAGKILGPVAKVAIPTLGLASALAGGTIVGGSVGGSACGGSVNNNRCGESMCSVGGGRLSRRGLRQR